MTQQTVKLLTYTGKAQDISVGSTRFVTMIQAKVLLGTEEQLNEPALLSNEASKEENKSHKVPKDAY